eukprot:TRINITY_DN16687_c0_g1_i2.p1 TRINITY_DN16687_c0_g1~~TRINITY_DN16687_c0_g1_i2.p1  ORF type:complete len:249 (-),score=62.91 TRINITY_DN16687_c0_g1_i2:100-846(-)
MSNSTTSSSSSSSSSSSGFSSFFSFRRKKEEPSLVEAAIPTKDSEAAALPLCIFVENPKGDVETLAWTQEFQDVMEKQASEREAANRADNANNNYDYSPYFFLEQELQMEMSIMDRRKRLLLFMIAIDLCYCTIWLTLQNQMERVTVQNKNSRSNLLQQIYLISCIVVDVIGVFGVLREYTWIVTFFVLAEGAALGFSTMATLSPFIFFHLAILLLSLQIRIGLVKKRRLEQELEQRRLEATNRTTVV